MESISKRAGVSSTSRPQPYQPYEGGDYHLPYFQQKVSGFFGFGEGFPEGICRGECDREKIALRVRRVHLRVAVVQPYRAENPHLKFHCCQHVILQHNSKTMAATAPTSFISSEDIEILQEERITLAHARWNEATEQLSKILPKQNSLVNMTYQRVLLRIESMVERLLLLHVISIFKDLIPKKKQLHVTEFYVFRSSLLQNLLLPLENELSQPSQLNKQWCHV